MKRKKLIVFVLSFSFVLFFGMLGNVIIMNTKEKSSEVNTTEFTATIKSIEIDGEGTNEYCIIFSEEYGNKLSTYNIRKISEISDFNRLESGQTVFFRVENIWLNQFEEMTFIPIVSIRTGEKEIVSLNNYNEYMDDLRLAPTIAGIAVALIIYCVLLLKVRMLLPM
jgi:hypothetical protein